MVLVWGGNHHLNLKLTNLGVKPVQKVHEVVVAVVLEVEVEVELNSSLL